MSVLDLESFRARKEAAQGRAGMSILKSKVAVSASLASVLILATVGNVFVLSKIDQQEGASPRMGRGIASIEIQDSGETSGWFRELLRARADKLYDSRKVASVAQKPSLMDQLRFGDLEGKYAVRVEDGALREIQFVNGEGSSDRPKYMDSTEDFLRRYQALHKIDFEEILKTRSAKMGTTEVEVLELRAHGATKSMVEVTRDDSGRLMNLKILAVP